MSLLSIHMYISCVSNGVFVSVRNLFHNVHMHNVVLPVECVVDVLVCLFELLMSSSLIYNQVALI